MLGSAGKVYICEGAKLSLKEKFFKFRDDYVIKQVEKLQLPAFPSDNTRRYRVIFSGWVQKVGFRLEVDGKEAGFSQL